jgi:hypothetical protein
MPILDYPSSSKKYPAVFHGLKLSADGAVLVPVLLFINFFKPFNQNLFYLIKSSKVIIFKWGLIISAFFVNLESLVIK